MTSMKSEHSNNILISLNRICNRIFSCSSNVKSSQIHRYFSQIFDVNFHYIRIAIASLAFVHLYFYTIFCVFLKKIVLITKANKFEFSQNKTDYRAKKKKESILDFGACVVCTLAVYMDGERFREP